MASGIRPDVVLVHPPHGEHPRRGGVSYTSIPLGLAYLASVLEESGVSVSVVDCAVESASAADIAGRIGGLEPAVVGISVTSPALRFAAALVSGLRGGGVSSGIRVAVGGPHVGADPASSALLGADAYFAGEAEYAFRDWCLAILGRERSGGKGEHGRGGGDETASAADAGPHDAGLSGPSATQGFPRNISPGFFRCGEVRDLDCLPYPARHLFRRGAYGFTAFSASRGCPFGCAYCRLSGSAYRKRGLGGVDGELERLVASGRPRTVDFTDDTFSLDRGFAWEVASLMRKHALPWACTTRADRVDAGLIGHFRECGCFNISFGVESGSEALRKGLGKDIADDSYVAAFRLCRDSGIRTRAYFMLGLPGETREDVRRTFDFAARLSPDDVMYSPAIVYPGTRLMDAALAEGRVPPTAWADYLFGKAGLPLYVPDGMSADWVCAEAWEANKRFYLTPAQILERFRSAQSIGDVADCLKAAGAYFADPVLGKRR